MSRSSSFSIGKNKAGRATLRNASHNDRTRPPSYIIDYEAKNEVSCCKEDVRKHSEKLLRVVEKERAKLGIKKLSTQVYKMKEAVVNLKADSTLEEVNEIGDYLNQEYGLEILQTAVHKDEGVWIEYEGKRANEWSPDDYYFNMSDLAWYDKDDNEAPYIKRYEAGKQIFYCKNTKLWYKDKELKKPFDMSKVNAKYNYHGHILYWNLDKQGRSISRTLQDELSSIQDKVAEIVKLKRTKSDRKGIEMSTLKNNIRQVENSKNKSTAQNGQEDNKPAKQKDLKEEISNLRQKLKDANAIREDYARLEELNRTLKQLIKDKDLTIGELKQKIDLFQEMLDAKDEENSKLKSTNIKLEKEVEKTKSNIEQSLKKIENLEDENRTLKEEISTLYQENRTLKKFANAVKKIISEKLTNSPIHNLEDVLRRIKEYFNIKDTEPVYEVEQKDDAEHVKLKLLYEELSTVDTKYHGKIVSVAEFIQDAYSDGYTSLKELKNGDMCIVNEETEQKYNLKDKKYAEYADLYIKAQSKLDEMYNKTKGSSSEAKNEDAETKDQSKSKLRKSR